MKFRWLIVALLCLAAPASAFWQSRDSAYNQSVGAAPPAYQGPGDLGFGSALAWYGFRCYTAAYSGKVADISDNGGTPNQTTISCDGAGNLSLTTTSGCTQGSNCTAIATTCTSTCFVQKLYDQSVSNACTAASCDLAQATNANRPTFLYQSASCGTNSNLSCMQCTGATNLVQSANSLSSTAQTYYFTVAVQYTAATSGQVSIGVGGVGAAIQHGGTASKISMIQNGITGTGQTATDSVWHTIQGTFAGASSSQMTDGSAAAVTVGTTNASGAIRLCTGAGAGQMAGFVAEGGVWPSTSTFNATTMYNNQHSWYGF